MTMLSNYVHLHTLICIMIDDIHTYTHLSAHPHTHTHLPTTTNTYHADTHHADTHHAQNAHFAMHTDPKEVTGFGYVVDVVPPIVDVGVVELAHHDLSLLLGDEGTPWLWSNFLEMMIYHNFDAESNVYYNFGAEGVEIVFL